MSGGVLLNAEGKLIGIHGRGERNEQASSEGAVTLKTGINQGVPITFYNRFISGAPIVATSEVPTTADDYLAIAKASQDKAGREQSMIRAANQSLRLRMSRSGYFLRAYARRMLGEHQAAIADYKDKNKK